MRWLIAFTLVSTAALAGSPLVVIDPGHGGEQTGAIGPNGQREKNIALAISKQLKELLEKEFKATVVLTREKDALVQLSERVVLANKKQPDLFISIHANSMPTAVQRRLNQGIETYFLSAAASGEDAKKVAARENAESGSQPRGAAGDTLSFILADLQRSETHVDSSRLAYSVHEELILETQAQDRGVQQAPFYVLMGLEAPAILVEVGFVSHPEEGKLLTDAAYQARLARAISAGVGKFLEQIEARDGKK
ncbi:MAG: N-acetylmuramoyl-L-alanine amidase [Archangium sp.]|nr:N-acetylmuramoyl-L-alanine amidase [Archangium sp.]